MSSAGTLFSAGRRDFLALGGTLALGGCAHCRFPPASGEPERIGDAHAHFFNAADLPVAGFAKFVLIPRHFPDLPDFADALVDIIAYVAKALSLTAAQEARQLGTGILSFSDRPQPADFGRYAAEAHRMGLRGAAPVPEIDRLEELGMSGTTRADLRAESHGALAALLGGGRQTGNDRGPALSSSLFEAIASGPAIASPRVDAPADLQCPTSGVPVRSDDPAGEARTLLRWVYLMCRPRCTHVEEYLKTIARDGASVADAVNLLVDYDKWLNDDPRSGSRQRDQVAYWTRYSDVSAAVPGRLRLHSFAGYDPLRDAEERVIEMAGTTSFDTMKRWAIDGRDPASRAPRRIAGFKIYPPMGFRPDNNGAIDIPDARGGRAIRRRWGRDFSRLGNEIDRSLDAFFSFCVEQDIPVLTHARESNIAFENHGDDPSPRHWLNRIAALAAGYPDRKPLRLCIGHFDMTNCPDSPKVDGEVLFEALILNRARKARVYFDIGFDDRILAGRGQELFAEIAEVCRRAGDEGDYILFGSDWIMLANQSNANRYLTLAYEAARAVPFWADRLDKLFRANLQRFLDHAAD